MENLKRTCTIAMCVFLGVSILNFIFQSGSFFNDATTISNNYCKLSRAQQIQVAQFFNQIEQKWSITQQTFCLGINIEYPQFNLNLLFDSMLQTGNKAAPNGFNSIQTGSNFWTYYKKGFQTSAKMLKGPGSFLYDLGQDVNSFIQKNVAFNSNEPPPSNTLVRTMAMAKIKVHTIYLLT